MITRSVEARAYHEAGHATVACMHGIPFEGMLVEPDQGGAFQARTYGFDLGAWISEGGRDGELRIQRALEVLAAGEAAQLIQTGNGLDSAWGAAKDWNQASTILHAVRNDDGTPLDGATMLVWWERARSRVAEIFGAKGLEWNAVSNLAKALMTTAKLDFDQAKRIVDSALSTTEGTTASHE